MATGRLVWLAALPLVLGLQWTLGHFQIQTWTGGLVIVTGLWRAAFRSPALEAGLRRDPRSRLGDGVRRRPARPELAVRRAGRDRPSGRSATCSSIPSLRPTGSSSALPRLVRELRLGPEDPYWFGQQTTGYEAVLYVGTIPLIFALRSVDSPGQPAGPRCLWRLLVPISFAIATMPRWWPQGYLYLLSLPGLGYFRVPARYTLLTCLGLAFLAGEGFDRSISMARFRAGPGRVAPLRRLRDGRRRVLDHAARRASSHRPLAGSPTVSSGPRWPGLVAMAIVLAWRSGRLGHWAPLLAAAIELGILYYAGTTQWGWSIAIPAESPVLNELARQPSVGLIGGELENLPVRAGLRTGYPYLGFSLPKPGRSARTVAGADGSFQLGGDHRCLGRGHAETLASAVSGHSSRRSSAIVAQARDRTKPRSRPGARSARLPDAGPTGSATLVDRRAGSSRFPRRAWLADRARSPTAARSIDRLSQSDDLDIAWFLAEDRVPDRPDARSARLLAWDGSVATVEHDGSCDLVLARSFDPGWLARIDNGPERPVVPVDGGFQAVRLDGSGTRRVTLRYRTPQFALWATITLVAALLDLVLWAWSKRNHD